jgi:hypothetical protein
METYRPVEEIIKEAKQTLQDAQQLHFLLEYNNLPGEFIFSPERHRLITHSFDDLQKAREILKAKYNWSDSLGNKFYACGKVIAVYYPPEDLPLPLHFNLWLECPPEKFPKEILGNCKLVSVTPNPEYTLVCKTEKE